MAVKQEGDLLVILGGIDTIEYSVDIAAYGLVIADHLDRFERLKEAAQESGRSLVEISGVTMEVAPAGIRNYAYGFKCQDFWVFLSKREMPRNYPVWVKVSSGALWSLGLETVHENICQWLMSLGLKPVANKVSRADLTVDTDELDLSPWDRRCFVTRADKVSIHEEHGRLTGFTIGGGNPVMLRIYDKTVEVSKSGKDWMMTLWLQNGWDGGKVWRVEYQCRRDLLRELHIESIEDLNAKTRETWGYLSRKWFRLKGVGNNGKVWPRLESGFGGVDRIGVRQKVVQNNMRLLMDMGKGVLKAIGASLDEQDAGEVAHVLATYAEKDCERRGESFGHEVEVRRKKFVGAERKGSVD